MQTRTGLLIAAAFLLLGITPSVAGSKLAPNGRNATAELLVKWADGPESDAAKAGNASIGAEVERNFNAIGWQHVKLPDGLAIGEAIARYRALGTVLNVEPNYAATPIRPRKVETDAFPSVPEISDRDADRNRPALQSFPPRPVPVDPETDAGAIPNDPKFNSQWDLKKISMTNAWSITTGSTNVVVAVIDSGVDYNHPDLAPNMWHNPGETGLDAQGRDKATNGVDDDGDGYVDDVYGISTVSNSGDPMDYGTVKGFHGTHDAGTIGAVGNNGLGITGINWEVRIMAVATTSSTETSYNNSYISHVVAAFDYVVEQARRGVKVRVISADLNNSDIVSNAFVDALFAAGREDILVVWAADNASENLDFDYFHWNTVDAPNVIVVAATDQADVLASFSNYGRSTVHLAAPGTDMPGLDKGGKYVSNWNGTSASCPHVAGVAALLCAAKPDITVDEMKAALLGSVDPLPSLKGKVRTNGRLNAFRALQSLTNASAPAIVIDSTPHSLRTAPDAPIQVTFNKPMDRASVEAAFVVSPALAGTFEWSGDSRTFTFRHPEPFQHTNYTAKIGFSARDAQGGGLDGSFDRVLQNASGDDYLWTFGFKVTNDDFADAQLVDGAEGSVAANSFKGTWETGQPDLVAGSTPAASLWYRWIAPRDGWFTFDLTQGTKFDSILGVFGGTHFGDLLDLADNHNYGGRIQSRCSFAATAGASYSILVAGDFDDPSTPGGGDFKLRWYPTPPPVITGFSPSSGVAGKIITLTGTDFSGATGVKLNGASLPFTYSTNANFLDLRLLATVPADATSGLVSIETPHGNFTTTSEFTVFPAPALTVQVTPEGNVVVSWPDAPGGFNLESSDALGDKALWKKLALPAVEPSTPGLIRQVDGASDIARFYRLKATP